MNSDAAFIAPTTQQALSYVLEVRDSAIAAL
jgi:hypothetical protein